MAFHTKEAVVKLTSQRTVRIPVLPGTTVGELCEKVAVEQKNDADIITLKFGGKVLKRSKTMYNYGIREETELKVQLLNKVVLQVHFHLPNHTPEEKVSVEIFNTSCLSELKTRLTAVKPDFPKFLTFHIGEMTLKMDSFAYEECIKDGEDIVVRLPHETAEQEARDREENERQEVLHSLASSMPSSQRKVDIVFSFDTTGSMYSLLSKVKEHLRESVTRLMTDIPNIRIGLIAHGDYCDEYFYVLRKHDLSDNMAKLVKFVEDTKRSNGEGFMACYEWVLRHANGLSWRDDAAKALVVIGDVVPHPPSYTNLKINWRKELEALCENLVYGVQAKLCSAANSFYKYMARKSGGAYIKFHYISLITDMFLAENLETNSWQHIDEVENEGRMTEEMRNVMAQLEKSADEEQKEEKEEEDGEDEVTKEDGEEEKRKEEGKEKVESERVRGADAQEPNSQGNQEEEYVRDAWWDPSLDDAERPAYWYIYSMNYWTHNGDYKRLYNIPTAVRKCLRPKTLKRGCTIM